jgi:hypothetical protein
MASVLYMSMSLDGFVAQRDEDPGPLHEWVFPGADGGDFDAAVKRLTGVNRRLHPGTNPRSQGVGGRSADPPPSILMVRNVKVSTPHLNWCPNEERRKATSLVPDQSLLETVRVSRARAGTNRPLKRLTSQTSFYILSLIEDFA